MNILVIGRAKTGTTIISKTIQNSLSGQSNYILEPKDIGFFFNTENFPVNHEHVVKVIFEHWDQTPRSRMALVCNETPIKFERRVFIVRDPRDELLSRLMYFVRPWTDAHGRNEDKNSRWVDALRKKESNPLEYSFLDMVGKFDSIYDTQMMDQVLKGHGVLQYMNFTASKEANDYLLKYEDFIQNDIVGLEAYLGFPLTKEREVGNLSRTRRTATFNNWKSFFIEDDIKVLQPIYSSLLDTTGYTSWSLMPEDTLDSKNYSEYVLKLIDDR